MSKKIVAVPGARYGRLEVVGECSPPLKNKMKQVFWECICDCGNTHKARSIDIRQGRTLQCSDCARQQAADTYRGPRLNHLRAYYSWSGMKSRCLNPRSEKYHRYGGRGITICDSWVNDFSQFLADMGDPPEGASIDRIDNDLGYTKSNCKWSTPAEQSRNRSNNTPVTINGETMILVEWCEKLDLKYGSVINRITAGWDYEKALTTPF